MKKEKTAREKVINILLIGCFLVAIAMPLLLSDKNGGKVSTKENRNLAKFPAIFNTDNSLDLNLQSDLESWINDNAFGRKQATSLNALIDWKLFHQLESGAEGRLMYGKNNWTYRMNDYVIQSLQHDIPSKAELDQFSKKATQMNKYFSGKNAKFFIMVFPNKVDIYPENLLDQVQQKHKESFLDVYRDLGRSGSFDLSVVYDDIVREKNSDPSKILYFKAADSYHWNHLGAFIGYTDVMENVKKYFPNIKILTKKDFNLSPVQYQTIIAKQIFTTETDYCFQPKRARTAVNDQSFFDKIGFRSNDPARTFRYYRNPNSTLPKALIIGDSYTWELCCLIWRKASRSWRIYASMM